MIYMDNAATTSLAKEVIEEMNRAAECFGNPSSLHRLGIEAEKIVENAREAIAARLGVNKKNIYFTSGGTEANNTAIIGKAMSLKKRGNHIVTSKIEHPSVLESFKYLEEQGFEVSYIESLSDGRMDIEDFEAKLRDDTVLVSVMHVNNETGVVQPVDKLKSIMKKKCPVAKLHVDAVQSFCKIDILPVKWGIDLVSVSAHKIHGPKGVGALYIADNKVSPIIHGGGQQGGIRPGTENVLGIAGFGKACEICRYDLKQTLEIREIFKKELMKNIPDIKINGSDEYASGTVLNVSFVGVKAEILLHAFETKGLFVSTGSACSTHKPQPSHVLTAMGLDKKQIEGAVRFSFDEFTTKNDIYKAAEIVKEETQSIRKHL